MSLDELLHRSQWLNTFADSLPVLIWCAGPDGACTYFNQRWLDFTGRTLHESLGDGWSKDVHPDDRMRVVHDYYHYLEGRRSFRLEYRLRYKGGPYKWIVDFGSPVFDHAGTFLGYVGGCVDVTLLKGSALATSWREKYDAALHDTTRPFVDTIAEAEIAIRDRLDDAQSDALEIRYLREALIKLVELKRTDLCA